MFYAIFYSRACVSAKLLNGCCDHASRIPSNQINGYYKGGIGYKVSSTIQESVVLGTIAPVLLNLYCYAKAVTDDSLSCRSDLRDLPSVPGFNMLKAHLPIPSLTTFNNTVSSSDFSVRRSQAIILPGQSGVQYYESTREMDCVISN